MERLIGIYSPAPRSGKTFAATVLAHKGYQPLSFAEPIKRMAIEFFVSLGYSKDKAVSLAWVNKGEIIPEINASARFVLQTIGTEWGRNYMAKDIWVTCLCARAQQFSHIVVDDVRFENEAEAIKSMGGEVWCIKRPSATNNFNHVSEGALDDWDGFDHFINNSGTLEEFRSAIDLLVQNAW
jgi:hypothetical protein